MSQKLKIFIDVSKTMKLLEEFHTEGWTKKGHLLHKKLMKYLNSIEGLTYDISYTNMKTLGIPIHVWSTVKYNVPQSKKGHLKKYRGHEVLIIVLNQPNGFKRTIGCYPIKEINE